MTDVEDSALMDGMDTKWRSLTSSDITCRFFRHTHRSHDRQPHCWQSTVCHLSLMSPSPEVATTITYWGCHNSGANTYNPIALNDFLYIPSAMSLVLPIPTCIV